MGRLLLLMAPLALAVLAASSPAEQIVVQSVVASSTADPTNAPPDNLINGSGLSGGLHDTDLKHMWLASAKPATVTFTFGQLYQVTELDIWNYNATVDKGAKDFTVLAALDGGFTAVGSFVLSQAPGNTPLAAQVFTPIPFQARSLQLDLTSSYNQFSPLVGLSEVQLFGAPVPEPSTLAGLLGMGLLGAPLLWRRMRRSIGLHWPWSALPCSASASAICAAPGPPAEGMTLR